jgi:ABC-type uncharacterized transport system permease subunit
MDWSLILLRAALVLYALAFLNTFVPVSNRRRTVRFTPWLAGLGALAHTGALWALGLSLGRCPLGTLPEVLSVLAWTTVLVYLAIVRLFHLEVLHAIILPLVLVVLFISDLLPGQVVPITSPLRPWLRPLHVFVIVLGLAALFITFAASLVYVLVDRSLKAKRLPRFFLALPSLERCERVGRTSLFWAFPLLTLGIVTGAIVSAGLTGHYWTWQPRETLAVLAWMILGAVVVARLGWGWRGRKAAILTIVGFAALFLRMLGI